MSELAFSLYLIGEEVNAMQDYVQWQCRQDSADGQEWKSNRTYPVRAGYMIFLLRVGAIVRGPRQSAFPPRFKVPLLHPNFQGVNFGSAAPIATAATTTALHFILESLRLHIHLFIPFILTLPAANDFFFYSSRFPSHSFRHPFSDSAIPFTSRYFHSPNHHAST